MSYVLPRKPMRIGVFLLCLFLFPCAGLVNNARASPTGLNNIPTADVVPENVLVLQTWLNVGENQLPAYYFGLKYGLFKGLEIGIDGKVGTEKTGPATFQFKYQLPFLGEDSKLTPLIGVENISDNTERAGKVNPYVVFTYDFELLRGHLGYNFQEGNDGVFGGLDKTLQLFEQDFVLKGDLKQTQNGDELLGSFGFLYVLPANFILESWVSFPTEDGLDETFTIKLNYVIEF